MSAFDTTAPASAPPPARLSSNRLFYWSVRRELWENRSIYIAPLAVAGLVVVGFLLGTAHPPHIQRLGRLDPADQAHLREIPYDVAAVALIVVSLLVGVFYCLGALHNERRDRSILFWKSLPVSDLIAALAKAFIPLIALPVVTFAVILVTQVVMLLINTVALLGQGDGVASLWAQNPVFSNFIALPYGLVVLSLWYAPVYGWLLLVSAWARRTPILWALAPVIGLPLVEKLALGTSYIGEMLKRRLHGGFTDAFATPATGRMHVDFVQPEPLHFLATPDLWIGLGVATAFIASAVWLRRRGEPI